MRALVIALPLLLFFVAGYVSRGWSTRQLRQRQRWELDLFRAQQEDVIRLCMQHMDVEPFARLVWDALITPTTPTLKGKQ